MIPGSTWRNTCIFLGCLALSLFTAQLLFGEPVFGSEWLYRLRRPLEWQTEAEDETSRLVVDQAQGLDSSTDIMASVALVVASQSSDNTDWLKGSFPEWEKNIYVTNDRHARLTVPKNKGREGMVYLTYIIDNYDHLPEIMIFRHAERYQWHSDDPLLDGQRLMSRIQLPYIREKGYTNLRCGWILTCPASVRPHDDAPQYGYDPDPDSEDASAATFYKQAFETLFPGEYVPDEVGGPCCAQFAVTSARIRRRPKADYERFRTWLTETPLNDDLSGRVMEYSWHIIFGEPAVSCPPAEQCYCGLYGICNLECEDEGNCPEQYTMPEWSSLPEGWPDIGWDEEWRNVTEMRMEYDEKHPVTEGA